MRLAPRWRKLRGDLQAMQGRLVMMVLAVAVGILGVTAILTAYTILTREISRNYLDTQPAAALLELDRVDPALVEAVRRYPGIADAQAGSSVLARIEVAPDQWLPLLLFVIPDFNDVRIGRFRRESGAWPPAPGTLLLERTAFELLHARAGASLRVQTPDGPKRAMQLAGAVHDPGLAPALQERTAYGYITPATLAWLGEGSDLHVLKVTLRAPAPDMAAVERSVSGLAAWLGQQGHVVHEIRIPPPGKHPHQNQMTAILVMLLIFSAMALLLGAILIASMIDTLLAQQIRQIGIMKAIGARTRQIVQLYVVLIVLISVLALAAGLPLGAQAGRGFARAIAHELNFTLYSEAVPAGVYAIEVLVGLLIPLAIALLPILRVTGVTVRAAISDFGISRAGAGRWHAWLARLAAIDRILLLSIRNTFRRRGRLILTLGLLASAGAMFMTSLNVKSAWERNLADAAADRRYDLEIRLNQAQPEQAILDAVRAIDGVASADAWNLAPAAAARADGLDIVRTYPDGGHGSFALRSVPARGGLIDLTLLQGRWLQPGDTDAVVLNHVAHALLPDAKVGQRIALTVAGRQSSFLLVGIVREIITPATAYTTPPAYAKATGQSGQLNALRVVMTRHDDTSIDAVTRRIEQRLEQQRVSLKVGISEARLAGALSGHVRILIVALIAMSVVMAIVGMLGLAAAMSTSVFERTREFGVMRTIGGTRAIVLRSVVGEGVFIGLMSWCLAMLAALPLSAAVGRLVGKLAFQSPLPLSLSPMAMLIWLLAIVLGSLGASALPALSAARLTIRNTLVYI